MVFAGAPACAALGGEGDDASEAAATRNATSYVGAAVVEALTQEHADQRDKTWGVSSDNTLSTGFLLQVPAAEWWGKNQLAIAETCREKDQNCDPDFLLRTCSTQSDCEGSSVCTALLATVAHPGDAPRSLCIGHSERYLDQIYGIVTHAKRQVDVTSLTPPNGRFEAAVRNAITFVTDVTPSIEIRLMFGNYPGEFLLTSTVLHSLTRDVRSGSPAQISVAAYRKGLLSWNHSKIVAADGEVAMVGGVNMWSQHYLEKDPVPDMSMRVEGSAASDAQSYANQIWDFACADKDPVSTLISTYPDAKSTCLPSFVAPKKKTGGAAVISVGRLGAIGANSADTALVALVRAAKKTLRLSQQDLGPVKKLGVSLNSWPEAVMNAIIGAMGRGVEVDLALSNLSSTPGGVSPLTTSYSNGWSLADVAKKFSALAHAHPELLPANTDVDALICDKLHLANLRSSAAITWPDGGKLASHAKLIIVDDRTFYLGSQNLYVANLAEYGFIVDDQNATRAVLREYYEPMFGLSKSTLASGSDAPSCALQAN